MKFNTLVASLLGLVLLTGIALTFERGPVVTEQTGYRGLSIGKVENKRKVAALLELQTVPEAQPPAEAGGKKASEAYQNVKVLGDLSENEFNRVMAAITEWVAPDKGCAYCHGEEGNFAEDKLYTKIVARRMLQMTRHINADWQKHVGATGVTCYTCHRGNPVPQHIWFTNPGAPQAGGTAALRTGQNEASPVVAYTSLPNDPFSTYLMGEEPIRVVAQTALPEGGKPTSTQATEGIYGLMLHQSQALGVNCTFCHNARNFSSWDQSPPTRTTAWFGQRMVRDLNQKYLALLQSSYPEHRLGATGDAPKANCMTCHQGVHKPLNGVSMLKDYPELAK